MDKNPKKPSATIPNEQLQPQYLLPKGLSNTEMQAWNRFQNHLQTQQYNGKPLVGNTEVNNLAPDELKNHTQGLVDNYNNSLANQYANSPAALQKAVPLQTYIQNNTITPNHITNAQKFYGNQTKQDGILGSESSQITYPTLKANANDYTPKQVQQFGNKLNQGKLQPVTVGNGSKKYVAPVYHDTNGKVSYKPDEVQEFNPAIHADQMFYGINPSDSVAKANFYNLNGYTKAPIVQAKASGGAVKSALASKIKGYDDGGLIPDINSGTSVTASPSAYDTQSNDYQKNGGSSSALANSITNKSNDTYSNKFNLPKVGIPNAKSTAPQSDAYTQTPGYGKFVTQQQTADSTNNTVNSAISAVPVIGSAYGLGKSASGVTNSFAKKDANGNVKDSDAVGRFHNIETTPVHEQAIDDFSKGNTGYGLLDLVGGKGLASLVGSATGDKKSIAYADSTNNPSIKYTTKLNPKTGLYENVGSNLVNSDGQQLAEGGPVKGGLVKGIGGPKSDSISAKVKGDSFVVPAENVGLAKQIKLHVLGKNPEEKAELKQSGGENVKLSNTEMLFTPEERYELLRKGVDLNALAPNAANTLKNHLKGGGSVKSYMQMCADGDNIDDLNDKLRKAKADEDAKIASQTANSPFRNAKIPSYNQINNPEKNYGLPFYDNLINSPATSKNTTPTKKSALASKIATPKYTTEPIEIKPYSNLATSTSPTYTGNPYVSTNSTALINNGNPNNTNTTQKGNGFDYGSAIGLGQSALGLGLLLDKNNKRPVDSLAPAFQSQLAASIAQSKYGYTPEQKSLLNEQQIEGRNNALGAVYNAAGGNGAVALNNARQVFNDSYKSKLATASDDEMLRLQKMNQANGMSQQDQEYRRRLFGDNMNKFQQNQAAYSNLVGAGLDNLIGSQRYGQQKQAQREIDKINAM